MALVNIDRQLEECDSRSSCQAQSTHAAAVLGGKWKDAAAARRLSCCCHACQDSSSGCSPQHRWGVSLESAADASPLPRAAQSPWQTMASGASCLSGARKDLLLFTHVVLGTRTALCCAYGFGGSGRSFSSDVSPLRVANRRLTLSFVSLNCLMGVPKHFKTWPCRMRAVAAPALVPPHELLHCTCSALLQHDRFNNCCLHKMRFTHVAHHRLYMLACTGGA